VDAIGDGKAAMLRGGDGVAEIGEGGLHTFDEDTDFEAGGAEDGELGKGDPLDGGKLLGGLGTVEVDGFGLEAFELAAIFQADDGMGVGGDGVGAGAGQRVILLRGRGGFRLQGPGKGDIARERAGFRPGER
jgi:hypothetical protein